MRVAVTGQLLDSTGYGEYGRLVAWAVHAAGHDLRVRNTYYAPERPERFGRVGELTYERLGRDLEALVDLSLIVYVPAAFDFLAMDDTLNVGLSMTETDVACEHVRRIASSGVRVLAVPSEWNRKAFRELNLPVCVIQPPVNPDLIPLRARDRGDRVEYLSIFSWGAPHKDPKALITAFCLAFSSDDPVRLTVKTSNATDEQITDDVHEAIRRAGAARTPEIRILCGSMSRQEVLDLYASSDVYVSSHHGEGWGLPIFEAMAVGIPAIATAFSAPLEYMDELNSYPVRCAYNEERGNADVDVDALANAMRRVFECPREASARGEAARVELRARFTAERTMAQVLAAYEEATRDEPSSDQPVAMSDPGPA